MRSLTMAVLNIWQGILRLARQVSCRCKVRFVPPPFCILANNMLFRLCPRFRAVHFTSAPMPWLQALLNAKLMLHAGQCTLLSPRYNCSVTEHLKLNAVDHSFPTTHNMCPSQRSIAKCEYILQFCVRPCIIHCLSVKGYKPLLHINNQ
jgi:hypothetical protein